LDWATSKREAGEIGSHQAIRAVANLISLFNFRNYAQQTLELNNMRKALEDEFALKKKIMYRLRRKITFHTIQTMISIQRIQILVRAKLLLIEFWSITGKEWTKTKEIKFLLNKKNKEKKPIILRSSSKRKKEC
jgi:hypothetical protein